MFVEPSVTRLLYCLTNMALIECPECHKKISDKSTSCPNCGLPAAFYTSHDTNPKNLDKLDLRGLKNVLVSFEGDYLALFSREKYLDTNSFEEFKSKYAAYFGQMSNEPINQYVRTNSAKFGIDRIGLDGFLAKMGSIQSELESHNTNYINRKLIEYKYYFDHIFDDIDRNLNLDIEQRRAVLVDDNHCLLVAGAGAGKTTTMATKVKYLVEKQNISPQDIIVISYTNKAVNELKERINKSLKIPVKIETFHSFAFDIVKKSASQIPEVNFSSYNIIFDLLAKSMFEDKALMRNLVLFLSYYFDLPKDSFNFASLNEYHRFKAAQDYETLKSGLGEYIREISFNRGKTVRTLTGEYLRSIQEVQIANYLYLNSIEYEYEKPYPHPIPGARKKYTPDFLIKQGEHEAYIEHYGLTDNMKNSVFTPNEIARYQKSISDKRRVHKCHKTTLIETWSSYSDGQSLLEHLKKALRKNGFVLKPRDLSEVYTKIVDTGKNKYINKLVWFMINFIEQYKTCGYDEGGFNVLRHKTDNARNLLFIDIAEKIYKQYQAMLKGRNEIDFSDMINQANLLLDQMETQDNRLAYKYIIIDEFQDVARQRFNLTKRLSKITKAKVVAVGDDWQSIYAFAGSDITLFTRFLQLMGSGTELKITHTYRNSQELIDIAGGFIQKNSTQIKKKLISPKHLKDPILLEFYNDKVNTWKNHAEAVNSAIGKIIEKYGENKSILLLGRYNFELEQLKTTGEFDVTHNSHIKSVKYPEARLTFMTVHSSKGLGYDNVIIMNMVENMFGFPCQIEDDPIMKLVTHQDASIPFAEERRLFYVALTRTKNHIYIMAPLYRPSRFLIELINDYQLPHPSEMNLNLTTAFRYKCPVCGFPLKREFHKSYGLDLYVCTNDVELCDFMTNDTKYLKDIFKCPKCSDGYLIVKKDKQGEGFYGCTNYSNEPGGCRNTIPFKLN